MFEAVAHEFADLAAPQAAALATRLAVAGLLGALLGWEREKRGKAAGLRTHILVAVGSAAFVAIPQQAGYDPNGVARVIQGLVAGIGFLGAGCIIKSEADAHVSGLTTAAGVWLTAAVGVAAGVGREASALLVGLFGWFTLSVLGRWEHGRHPGPPSPP
ncbi:MAG: MgtC/SapB family protein [Gemmataceae bacterium]|nr:MgtC/SapB family protein [Gemmataceae bacterium]